MVKFFTIFTFFTLLGLSTISCGNGFDVLLNQEDPGEYENESMDGTGENVNIVKNLTIEPPC